MDPNQQNVPQPNNEPTQPVSLPPVLPPTPVLPFQPYAPQPVVPQSQPYPPQPIVTQPDQPVYASVPAPQQLFGPSLVVTPQPVAPPQVIGSGPQTGFASVNNNAVPLSAKKPSKKLIIIIAAVVAGLAVLGIGAWLVVTLIANNITLKEYSNDAYSLLVPASYTEDVSETGVKFTEPKATEATQSQILVSDVDSSVGDKQIYIDAIDKGFTSESFNKSLSDQNDGKKITNINIDKTTQSGNPSRIVTADLEENGKKVGSFRYFVVFGDKKIFMVIIVAHESDPGLMANIDKITGSFKIK